MKILIHRNELRFVLYIKVTCTWFKICIWFVMSVLLCDFSIGLTEYRKFASIVYHKNTCLIICVMLSDVNLHYLTLAAARCPVSGCWPSCTNGRSKKDHRKGIYCTVRHNCYAQLGNRVSSTVLSLSHQWWLSLHLCLQDVSRDAERRAARLRQLRLV